MLPTRLNIIAATKKKFVERMIFLQFARVTVEIFLFVMCVVTITLVGSWWVLQSHFNSLAEQLTYRSDRQTERSLQIRRVNELLEELNRLQTVYTPWSTTITRVSNKVPRGIVLTSMRLDPNAGTYAFTGLAQTRDDLLLFEELLTTLEEVESVEIPLSQLTERTDISFSITAELIE